MSAASYPRAGRPIAPQALARFLDEPASAATAQAAGRSCRLRDFDASALGEFGAAACRLAAGEVLTVVARKMGVIGELRFTQIPERLEWGHLRLSVRAYNALSWRRGLPRPASLNGSSVADLLKTPAFGVKSLLDLLTALEEATGLAEILERGGAGALRSGRGGAHAGLDLSPREPAPEPALSAPVDADVGRGDQRRSLDLAVGLMKLEQALGPDVIHANDPRFGPKLLAVSPESATTTELQASLLGTLGRAAAHQETRLKALQTLTAGITEARGLDLQTELQRIVRTICQEAHTGMVLRFWGWDGRGRATLRQVGDEHGISRERVRQITQRAREQLEAGAPVFAPCAARALETVQGMLPASAATVADVLAREGLATADCDTGFLADLCGLLGCPPMFRFDSRYGAFVSTRIGEVLVAQAHRHAARLASKYGAACVEDVCDALRVETPSPPGPELVSRLLRARPDLLWLDDEHRWFCKKHTEGNLLLSRVRKVVGIAGRVRVSELRGGVERDYYLKGSVPPRGILLRLCTHDSALEVQGEIVARRDGAVLEGELSPSEKTLWGVLRGTGAVMERSQLEAGCLAAGMSRPSFLSTLTYSPIVIRYAPQVYGLRGVPIPPGAVESVNVPRVSRKGRLLQESGWAGDSRIRLVYKLTDGCVSNGIVSIPAAFTRFLEGDFRLLRLERPAGTLRCRQGQGWGLGPLFRRVGAEAGDTLTLEVDIHKSEALASVTAETPEERNNADRPPEQ
jgi:hypothetical protein